MRTHDHHIRIATALVFADRRVGETYLEAAKRAVEILEANGKSDIEPETVLEWACLERADRQMVNLFRARQSARNGKSERVHIDDKVHQAALEKLREEVGLVVKRLTP